VVTTVSPETGVRAVALNEPFAETFIETANEKPEAETVAAADSVGEVSLVVHVVVKIGKKMFFHPVRTAEQAW
jgi:hypothetical protein